MNRQTILAVIHRQLRENLAETGEVRPLGEVVGHIASEIRTSRNGTTSTGVIPIETVAAFVDGNLSTEESDAVCQAAQVDNSVLAELVSAVCAIGQSPNELDPLPEVLAGQLLAMQASLPTTDFDAELPIADPVAVAVADEAPQVSAEKTVRLAAPRTHEKSRRNRTKRHPAGRPLIHLTVLLSVAVTIAAIIFVTTRSNDKPPEAPDFVRNPPPAVPKTDLDPMLDPDIDHDSDIRIVESDHDAPPMTPTPPMIEDPPKEVEPSIAATQNDPAKTPDDSPGTNDVPQPDSEPTLDPDASKLASATKLTGLRWTKVTGVLTRQSEQAATSQSRLKTWESVQASPSSPPESIDRQLVLRTLPLSRAEATLDGGGKIVLAADSGMEVSKGDASTSANIHLQHGDLALIDLPQGTLIRLIKAGHPVAVLRWQSKASAVLQHAAEGLEVHVRHGTIAVNRQTQKDSSVNIARDRTVRNIDRPQRMPTWVDRPVATINVKQTFLAQIGESRNVMGTINQQIRGLAQADRPSDVDLRTMAILASWQAALAGENVFRLVGHQVPIVRLGALNRVASLPRWDPRFNRTWAGIENVARDKQRVQRFKRLCLLSQQQAAPSAALVNALLDDLAAPDVASRAMSDFLLRRFHANAARKLPAFDPTWTGQAQTRGVNSWRSQLGRTPNAAALRNQPAAQRNQGAALRVQGAAQQNQGAAAQNAAPRAQPAAAAANRQRD